MNLSPPVPAAEDQPDPEVGGGVEGAGLFGSHCLLRRPGRERTFPQVLAFGIPLLLSLDVSVIQLLPQIVYGIINME